MSQGSKLYAIVPAAGHSRRMQQPKLLLPLGDGTVIGRLLSVLDRDDIAERFVVVRKDDGALQTEVQRWRGTVLQPPMDPPDMRASVQFALDAIRDRHSPAPDDGWLLQPADHPLLEPAVLDALLARWNAGVERILVPTHAGKRGHPALFRWRLAEEVRALPPDCGLNQLARVFADEVAELEVGRDSILLDLDTPEDFQRLQRRTGDLQ